MANIKHCRRLQITACIAFHPVVHDDHPLRAMREMTNQALYSIRSLLEERVDERRCGGSTEQDQQTEAEDGDHDRCQPPFLVLFQEIGELARETRSISSGLGGEIVFLGIVISHL
jgi:hypothetical protein